MKDKIEEIKNKYIALLKDENKATQDEKDMLKFLTESSVYQGKETALRHFFSVLSALAEIEKL